MPRLFKDGAEAAASGSDDLGSVAGERFGGRAVLQHGADEGESSWSGDAALEAGEFRCQVGQRVFRCRGGSVVGCGGESCCGEAGLGWPAAVERLAGGVRLVSYSCD